MNVKTILFKILWLIFVPLTVYCLFCEQSWFADIFNQTGIAWLLSPIRPSGLIWPLGVSRLIMVGVSLVLLYLGIVKKVEPLLLLPIGIGGLLANLPGSGLTQEGGLLYILYESGLQNGVFPLLIFLGLGTMIDFTPMLANPKTAFLGGAAQFAIFGTFLGALFLSGIFPDLALTIKQAASIAIIGGADGPTSIFLSAKLAPELLGAVAVAAYSYMALVPIIQPPIMRALTTQKERRIKMTQLRNVSQQEKIIFPIIVILLTGLFVPMALPLIGMMMFGNLMKESGVCDSLVRAAKDVITPVATIFLGLCVGTKLDAVLFLEKQTLIVLCLGVVAFGIGTASGVLMAKIMNLFLRDKINPLIGSAGVSAIPMAARVSERLGLQADSSNHLMMHAMGANVAGSIGSAIAAGILLALCQ